MTRKSILSTFTTFLPTALLLVFGTCSIHLAVMSVEYLFIERIHLNLHGDFLGAVFSSPMVPVIMAYGILLASLRYLWGRTKQAMEQAHRYELELEKQTAVREALQKLTLDLSENIVAHNSEILKWVGLQKMRGRQVSERVEHSSQAIAESLSRLTEQAFVTAYHDPARLVQELEGPLEKDVTPRKNFLSILKNLRFKFDLDLVRTHSGFPGSLIMQKSLLIGTIAIFSIAFAALIWNGGLELNAQNAPPSGGGVEDIKGPLCAGLQVCTAQGEKECEKVVFSFAQTYCGGENPGEGLGEYAQYVKIACPIASKCKPDGIGSAFYCKQAVPLLQRVCGAGK